ncbi:MAG: hypothetical protein K2X27_02965 [Candidatus Obscuribacterales bacterium]|nr:hypothetical protein [Candidatus Obscuribacterales bacterium]
MEEILAREYSRYLILHLVSMFFGALVCSVKQRDADENVQYLLTILLVVAAMALPVSVVSMVMGWALPVPVGTAAVAFLVGYALLRHFYFKEPCR